MNRANDNWVASIVIAGVCVLAVFLSGLVFNGHPRNAWEDLLTLAALGILLLGINVLLLLAVTGFWQFGLFVVEKLAMRGKKTRHLPHTCLCWFWNWRRGWEEVDNPDGLYPLERCRRCGIHRERKRY